MADVIDKLLLQRMRGVETFDGEAARGAGIEVCFDRLKLRHADHTTEGVSLNQELAEVNLGRNTLRLPSCPWHDTLDVTTVRFGFRY